MRSLREYSAGLREALGEALDAVILYGSHARGDARSESDVDVLCVPRQPFDYGQMITSTSDLTSQMSLKYGVAFSRAFVTRDDYEN